jgi:hypothetical protein
VAYLLASTQLEQNLGPHGIDMDLATDPAIVPRLRTELVVDHVAADQERTQKRFREDYDHQDQSGWRYVTTLDD